MPPLHLTYEEAVTLSLLVGVGGTAFDAAGGIGYEFKTRFEKRFGIEVSETDIANIITKVGRLLRAPGDEQVVIDDD